VTTGATPAEDGKAGGGIQRILDVIERGGNSVPHPAVLFLTLCVGVIVLSALLHWAGWSATYEVVQPPPQSVEQVGIGGSVLPGELLPAEQAPASSYHLVRETAKVQSLISVDGLRFLFTSFIDNFMGFTAVGINDAIHLVDPARSIDITANLYFAIGSTILLTVLLSLVSTRLAEPRLGAYDSRLAPSGGERRDQPDTFESIPPELDSRGLGRGLSDQRCQSDHGLLSPDRRVRHTLRSQLGNRHRDGHDDPVLPGA
jgi:p-aminobenzoyl-glutamate transporter AbgT